MIDKSERNKHLLTHDYKYSHITIESLIISLKKLYHFTLQMISSNIQPYSIFKAKYPITIF